MTYHLIPFPSVFQLTMEFTFPLFYPTMASYQWNPFASVFQLTMEFTFPLFYPTIASYQWNPSIHPSVVVSVVVVVVREEEDTTHDRTKLLAVILVQMERISMRYPRVASYQQKRYFNTSWASYQWKTSVLSATGIISMVNVCFFDSICQVLYSLTEFWRYVVDDEEHLPLFPNYSICSCSIQQWHHMNGRHVATFSRWKRLRQEEQSHRTQCSALSLHSTFSGQNSDTWKSLLPLFLLPFFLLPELSV